MKEIEKYEYMTTKEVAKYLRRSEYAIREWVKEGVIPAIRPGGKNLLFRRQEIDYAIGLSSVNPSNPTGRGMARETGKAD